MAITTWRSSESSLGATIVREGLRAGILGAAASALWFLLVDIITGRPLFTPAILGAATFAGQESLDIAIRSDTKILLAVGYTAVHVTVFSLAGLSIATVLAALERTPAALGAGILVLIFLFGFGFYLLALAFLAPISAGLEWWTVPIGNLLAAATITATFWRRHPSLARRLPGGV